MKENKMEHYLIVRFKKGVDVKDLYEPIRDLFSQAGNIEGIKRAQVYLSSSKLRNNYDMMIRFTMKKSSLPLLENSDLYRRFREDYSDSISRVTEFDA